MILGFASAAAVALVLPALTLLLTNRGGARAWALFKDGGIYAWLCVAIYVVALVLVGLAGAAFVAGKRIPGAVLFGGALAPFLIGYAGASLAHRKVVGVLESEAIDSAIRARIMAEGISEGHSTVILGSTMGAYLMWLVALACMFRVLAVAPPRAMDGSAAERRSSALGVSASLGAGVLALAIGAVVHVVGARTSGTIHGFGILVLLGVAIVAPLAAMSAPNLRSLADADERAAMVRTLMQLACAAGAGALLAAAAAYAQSKSVVFGAVSGESVDGAQRARILFQGLSEARAIGVVGLVDAVLGAAALVVPALFTANLGRGFATLRGSFATSVVLALLSGGAVVVHGQGSMNALLATAPAKRYERLREIELPVGNTWLPSPDDERGLLYFAQGGPLRLDTTGGTRDPVVATPASIADALRDDPGRFMPGETRRPATLGLVVDRRAKLVALHRALQPVADAKGRVGVVVAAPAPPTWDQAVAGADPDLFKEYGGVPLEIQRPGDPPHEGVLVILDGATARVVRGDGEPPATIPMGEDATSREERRRTLRSLVSLPEGWVRVAPREEDDVSALVTILDSVGPDGPTALRGLSRGVAVPTLALTLDRDPTHVARAPQGEDPRLGTFPGLGPQRPSTKAPSVRMGATTVTGRLPPEVIQRIVRMNFGRFRACYESGLKKDPTLTGKVTVKFVIDREGAVSEASDGGSDLPDKAVVACVVRAFQGMSFPQPEGGVVRVTYPIVFAPTN